MDTKQNLRSYASSPPKGFQFPFIRKQYLILPIYIAIAFTIYHNSLHSPFIFDDIHTIKNNPSIHLSSISVEGIKKALFSGRSRPFSRLSFALNFYFHKYDTFAYHVVNISIHIAASFFLFKFILNTLIVACCDGAKNRLESDRTSALGKYDCVLIAFLTSSLWIVHPLHTESVTYIVQRMNSMATMFCFLSLWLFSKGRMLQLAEHEAPKEMASTSFKKGLLFLLRIKDISFRLYYYYYGLAFVFWVAGVGSKETAAILPIVIFQYEWLFFQDLSFKWFKSKIKLIVLIIGFLLVLAYIFLGSTPIDKLKSINDFSNNEFTYIERLLTQPRVIVHYLSLIFFPHPSRLNLDYNFKLSHSLTDPLSTTLAILFLGGIFFLSSIIAKRDKILFFSIFWFFCTLLIESSVIPLAIIFEHRTYMPSAGIILLVVYIAYRLNRLSKKNFIGVIMSVAILIGYWTYTRNIVWQDDFGLWQDCIKKSPYKARPYNNAGLSLINKDKPEEAIVWLKKAISLNPNYPKALNNMGVALLETEKPSQAIPFLLKSAEIDPLFSGPRYNLGNAYAKLGKLDQAIFHYSEAIKLKTNYVKAYNNLANAYNKTGLSYQAIEIYRKALEIDPTYAEAHSNLGTTLFNSGKFRSAIFHFRKALQINSRYDEAQDKLKIAQKSITYAIKQIDINLKKIEGLPRSSELHLRTGILLRKVENYEQAKKHLEKALTLNPNMLNTLYKLAANAAETGCYDDSIFYCQIILIHRQDIPAVYYNMACFYSLMDHNDEALKWLEKAISVGYKNWSKIQTDDDLRNFRNSNAFESFKKNHPYSDILSSVKLNTHNMVSENKKCLYD